MLSRHLDWRGRRIAWAVHGSGPPVVFCHGTPWSSALWRPFADALSRDHAVHTWDMAGFGRSSMRPEHPVDLRSQVELLADLLVEWGLDAPHVVAHDVGGAVALGAHLLHGRPFRSLVLVDAVVLDPWGSPFFRLVQEHAQVFERLPAAVHEGALAAYVRTASHAGLPPAVERELIGPWLTPEGQAAFYRQIAQADDALTGELTRRLPDLRLPVRIVWGREDAWVPVARAEELHRLVPGSSLRLLDGAGHLVQLDAPVALADELRGWLDSHRSGAGAGR